VYSPVGCTAPCSNGVALGGWRWLQQEELGAEELTDIVAIVVLTQQQTYKLKMYFLRTVLIDADWWAIGGVWRRLKWNQGSICKKKNDTDSYETNIQFNNV
jgi:hypothetical protein